MTNSVLTIEMIKDVIAPIAAKYGVESIYVFGSYARGEATIDSDIDFLVFGGKGFKLSMVYALAEEIRDPSVTSYFTSVFPFEQVLPV